MRHLRDRISFINSASTKENAFEYFRLLAAADGYANCTYTFLTNRQSIGQRASVGMATTLSQDWVDHYSRKLQRIDPVWARLLENPTPFFWTEMVERIRHTSEIDEEKRKLRLRVMNEREDAGMADGISVSFVNPLGEIAGIGLSRNSAEKMRSYENLAEISLLASCFHDKFVSFFGTTEAPRLTPREREVLCWAAEGKADFDIGGILNVSASTVRFHWSNIFDKMGVNGRLRAVIKAMQLQIIMPELSNPPRGR